MKQFEKLNRKSSRKLATTKSTSTSKMLKKQPLESKKRPSELFFKHSSKQTTQIGDMAIKCKSQCVSKQKDRCFKDRQSLKKVALTTRTKRIEYTNTQHTQQQVCTQPRAYIKTEKSAQLIKKKWNESKVPYTSIYVLSNFTHLLTQYELQEINQYKKIYYLGQNAKHEKYREVFDNDDKEYIFVKYDHVAFRYQLLQLLGKGSYGQVFKAYDHKNKEDIALKIIKNRTKFKNQAFIQLKILTHVREADPTNQANVVKTKDMVVFRKHVCLVFQLLSENLYDLMVRNNHSGIGFELIRRFAIQILNTLVFLKKQKIIHCDLKPQNILLKEKNKSGIKIIDFGSSCFESEILYTYIQSRYYRAPEITLAATYGHQIDIWSTGCILAELYTSLPLFPGEHEREQMKYMIETLGPPPLSFIRSGQRANLFFEENGIVKNEIKFQNVVEHFSKPLRDRILDKQFCQFISTFLKWNPKERISPMEALNHPWIVSGLPSQLVQKKTSGLKKKSNQKGISSGRSSREKIKRSGLQF